VLIPTSSTLSQNSPEAFSLKTCSIDFDISELIPISLKTLPQVALAILGRFYKSEQSANSCELLCLSADRWSRQY